MLPLHSKLLDCNLVLASSSPRRYDILQHNLHIKDVQVIPSNFEENITKENKPCEKYVLETAIAKAKSVAGTVSKKKNTIVISSDTVITCKGKIYEKPRDKQSQFDMFAEYRNNRELEVITAVCLINYNADAKQYQTETGIETTQLVFDYLVSDKFLWLYINSGEGSNAAGGFKIQELGCLLFERINGDFYNIVGLPPKLVFRLLELILS